MPALFYILGWVWLMSLLTFAVYGYDKHLAYYAKRRVPEAVLLLMAVAGGAFGAWMGMLFFRHKTRKPLFRITVPLLTVLTGLLFLLLDYPYAPGA